MKLFAHILTVALALLCTAPAQTAPADPDRDNIAKSLSIVKTGDLDFGQIISPRSPGSVTVSPFGTRTASGVIVIQSSSYSPASFQVTGKSSQNYWLSLPSMPVQIRSGPNSMTLSNFTSNPDYHNMLRHDKHATDTITVGARLNISANQPSGSYAGTFDVIVCYD